MLNSEIPQYKPNYARAYCEGRHKSKRKFTKLMNDVRKFVIEKLRQEWSPDQISGYAKQN